MDEQPKMEKVTRLELPRLPVFGWTTFAGQQKARIPSLLGAANLSFCSSGRMAIWLALKRLGIGRGDAVLVPTYHCQTMIEPIVAIGARPVFFAIDESGAPRLDMTEPQSGSSPKAMLVAHYFGLPQPLWAVRRYCDEHEIALIEDCAHAMFGMSEGRVIGTWGDYAIGSLTKFFPVADGGCLTSAQRDLSDLGLISPSVHGEIRQIANTLELGAKFKRLPGLNNVLSAVFWASAALRGNHGRAAETVDTQCGSDTARQAGNIAAYEAGSLRASYWSRLMARSAGHERIVANRRRNYRYLAELLSDIPGARQLRPVLPEASAPYVFPLWVDASEETYQRVRAAGIPVFRWDRLWPSTPTLARDSGIEWSTRVYQLGCHQDLTHGDLVHMATTLRTIIER